MGRTIEIFAPFIFVTIILFTLLSIKDMDFKTLLPVLSDSGFIVINYGALSIASRFSEIVILCMLCPDLNKKNALCKTFSFSVVIFTLFFLIIMVSTQLVLGIERANHANYPYLTFMRQVSIFKFIERVESINIITWFIGIFIKFSIYMHFATVALSQIFGVKSGKVFIILSSVLVAILALTLSISKSVVTNKLISHHYLPYINFAFIFIVPLFLLVVYLFRKKSLAKYR